MPALTHNRVKNGYNGPSVPITNSKVYRVTPAKTDVARTNSITGSVGTSKAIKRAWERRSKTSKEDCCKE
tara:strand:+ start:405 stop:614 length:210 start_codon:yes stop_codon:yes gene_type:complete